jgi:biopolymer transport protein ExbD
MRIQSRARVRAGIPSASMADLALLLLIFFMTTTYFQVERGPTLTLPGASHGEERSREDAVVLHVDAGGSLFWEGRPVAVTTLAEQLAEERKKRAVRRVMIYADRTTPFDKIYPVLQGLRGEIPVPVVLAVEPIGTGVPIKEES